MENGTKSGLRLRPYKSCDAKSIAGWLQDEEVFLKWGGNLFGKFPINENIIDDKYRNNNGDCEEANNFYPMTACDEKGAVGHFIMRYTGGDPYTIRFGWVIVDNTKRGKGYGSEMLRLGLKYAFQFLNARKVTIGVYENNQPAHQCYKAVGFREIKQDKFHTMNFRGKEWRVIELEITKDEYNSSNILKPIEHNSLGGKK